MIIGRKFSKYLPQYVGNKSQFLDKLTKLCFIRLCESCYFNIRYKFFLWYRLVKLKYPIALPSARKYFVCERHDVACLKHKAKERPHESRCNIQPCRGSRPRHRAAAENPAKTPDDLTRRRRSEITHNLPRPPRRRHPQINHPRRRRCCCHGLLRQPRRFPSSPASWPLRAPTSLRDCRSRRRRRRRTAEAP
jgi:hypothetical protein